VNRAQLRALRAIEQCRTAALGGHLEHCCSCRYERPAYNSCRNRHCPKCQTLAKERWFEKRRRELLPVGYFHVVFTLPEELRVLALWNQEVVYDLMLKAAGRCLLEIGRDPRYVGGMLGVLAILHTWTQTLEYHPHVHCVVPGGGLDGDGRWVSARKHYLAPVRALSRLYRGKLVSGLRSLRRERRLRYHGAAETLAADSAFDACLDQLMSHDWVVYCKPPFGSPARVLSYLARYTHRVAISNDRIESFDGERVVIGYRDRTSLRKRTVCLSSQQFLGRFLRHVLPTGFVRIRCYGLLANRHRSEALDACRAAIPNKPRAERSPLSTEQLIARILGRDPQQCPRCGTGRLRKDPLPRQLRESRAPPPP
jgi:hypothetical protein